MLQKYKLGQYRDDRGVILWASPRLLNFEYTYLTIATMTPGSARGGHYHKKMEEKLMCIMGEIRFQLENEIIVLQEGDIINIPIGKVHTLYNDTDEVAAFIEFKSMDFDSKKDDTYTRKN